MSFAVTVLGSSSAIPTSTRFPTAQVLNVQERFFLIDCGEGTQIQLRRYGINLSRIQHIFISHLHGDHIFGLFGLFSSLGLSGRKSAMHLYAHQDYGVTLDHYLRHFGVDLPYQIVFHPFTASKPVELYSDKHLTVETIPLRHSIPVVGFIFREKAKALNIRKGAIERYSMGIRDIKLIKEGQDFITAEGEIIPNRDLTLPPLKPRSYAFCTDTLCYPKLASYLNDIDLLYFEATFAEKDKKLAKITGHSTAAQAAALASAAKVGKLLIGHFSTRYKNTASLLKEARAIFPETTAVEDGEKFPVEQVRVETRI